MSDLNFPVSPEKQKLLKNRMEALGIKESDLIESFIKSGGKGGQNVNKVSTTVYLRHSLSGIEIKCSVYRTQGLNRYKARYLLCEKLENSTKVDEYNKIKKQKKRRKRKSIKKSKDSGI